MSVLAANDQENLVHALQAGAAGKSLNAGLKGINTKTPGNKAPKTPFKIPLNDENAAQRAGKSVLKTNGKGNENLLMTTKKGGKLDDNAFVTPAGPRTRAPLGMKTTNAKAKAFQTPAPLSASAKTQKLSPRLRRPKVKVHQPEPLSDEDDDIPEVEYMPPKEAPLPDNLDEDMPPINWNFPMLKGPNKRGMYASAHHNPVEADGRTRAEREWEEDEARDNKKSQEQADKLFNEAMAKEDAETRRYLGIESPQKPAAKSSQPPRQAPSTLNARSAAAALSPPPKSSYAAPTTSANTKSRIPSALMPSRKPAKPTMNPSISRNAAAAAASKSTIGYAQGRTATNTTARKPISNVTRPPSTATLSRRPTTASSSLHNRSISTNSAPRKPRGAFSRSSSTSTNATLVAPAYEENYQTAEDVEREVALMLLHDEDDEDVDAWMNTFKSQLGDSDPTDEQYEDFQLQLPEDF